jgi:hypothetical protein
MPESAPPPADGSYGASRPGHAIVAREAITICIGAPSGSASLSALLADAHRHLAVGDPSDDDLAGLTASFRAAVDAHP